MKLPSNPMTTEELKDEIDQTIKHVTINYMLLWFINNPETTGIFKKTFVVDIAGFSKKDGTGKELSLHSAFNFCRSNPKFNVKYLKKVLMVEINWIFENLPHEYQYSYKNAYEGKDKKVKEPFSKEFEFFRHIRNACSHNNKFELRDKNLFNKSKNPHYEALWNGFNINLELDKTELFWKFIHGGDAIELLEFIRNII